MTSSNEYDKTNRGSLWPMSKRPSCGGIDVDGQKCTAYFMSMDDVKGNMPTHRLFIDYRDGSTVNVALWPPKKADSKAVLSGSSDTHWVHIFRNTNDNPKAPAFDVKLAPRDDAAHVPSNTSKVDQDDEINDLF